MPNYFKLVSKNAPETKVVFADVDDDIREHFGADASEDAWYRGWYDSLGWGFCMGRQPMEIVRDNPEMSKPLKLICEYLDRRFTVDAWSQRGR